MNISQKNLHHIIVEQINKLLNEYAEPRKEVIRELKGHFPQITINWILVHYCTLINEDINRCKNHWRDELLSQMNECTLFKLKGNNSFKTRLNVLQASENAKEMLSDYNIIDRALRGKFEVENIIINEEIFHQCINELINDKNTILNLLAESNYKNISSYVNTI